MTVVKFDNFALGIHHKKLYSDVPFYLYSSPTTLEQVFGLWLLTDNGYHRWRATIPPMKSPLTPDECVWTTAAESVRKDVECVFGILKRRFRILAIPFELHDVHQIDQVFQSCCILHNMLHDEDKWEERWEEGLKYTMEIGHDSEDDEILSKQAKRAAVRMQSAGRVGGSSSEGQEYFGFVDRVQQASPEISAEFTSFRSRLIQSFKFQKEIGKVTWLKAAQPHP